MRGSVNIYLSYPWAMLKFFAAGEIPHRDGGEIWRGALFVHARFYHHRCMASGVGPKIKNPLGNFFTKFSEFVSTFIVGQTAKTWRLSAMGFRVMAVETWDGFPQIFSVCSSKTIRGKICGFRHKADTINRN